MKKLYYAVLSINSRRHTIPSVLEHLPDEFPHIFVILDQDNAGHAVIEAWQVLLLNSRSAAEDFRQQEISTLIRCHDDTGNTGAGGSWSASHSAFASLPSP